MINGDIMKFIVVCGGTSGHINPAIAIANELKLRDPSNEILFIGTADNREADLIPRAGYPMRHIKANGFSRKKNFRSVRHNIRAVNTFLKSTKEAQKIIREFHPDAVIGTGGFVSAPVMNAATRLHVTTVIHEQNAFAGVTTKMLAPKVDRIYMSFPLSNKLKCDDSKCFLSGNPVKREFFETDRISARNSLGIPENAKVVLSCGGSLGARRINEAFCVMAKHSAEDGQVIHYHSASAGYDDVVSSIGEAAEKDNIRVFKYIYNMPQVMAASDIVISRSGAMSLAEIAALGKPSVLIPSPNVAENHQYFNAKTYEDAGASVLVEEKDLDGEALFRLIHELLGDDERLKRMSEAALKMANPDSAVMIADGIYEMLNK